MAQAHDKALRVRSSGHAADAAHGKAVLRRAVIANLAVQHFHRELLEQISRSSPRSSWCALPLSATATLPSKYAYGSGTVAAT